jgi:hypothetical protein
VQEYNWLHSGTMSVPRGHPQIDLGPSLQQHLWQLQVPLPKQLLISDNTKYIWQLDCNQHLRLMTVQAAWRQKCDQKTHGQLTACERCKYNYRLLGPASVPGDKHRSYWEQEAWLNLENVLALDDVLQYMSRSSHMYGADLGYVVEARVVKGWPAGVDIYVPALRLIIQVDGEHHNSGAQQVTDANFNSLAISGGHRVLRLHHSDVQDVFSDIRAAVRRCMQCTSSAWLQCTNQHPLAAHNTICKIRDDAYTVRASHSCHWVWHSYTSLYVPSMVQIACQCCD